MQLWIQAVTLLRDTEDVRAGYAQQHQSSTTTYENRQTDEIPVQSQLHGMQLSDVRDADTEAVQQRAWWTASQLPQHGDLIP